MRTTLPHQAASRVERLDRALEAQKAYIARVPDPDNRARAEENLSTLVGMREAFEASCERPR